MTQSISPTPSEKPAIADMLGIAIPMIEICDVGAMLEAPERYTRLMGRNLANVTGFEPNPAEFQKLQALNRPGRRYFPNFLGKGGPAVFHITRYPGCSSLYEPDPAMIDLFTSIGTKFPEGNFAVTHTLNVQTTRLDDIPGLPAPDYIKLDVQGAELDVLRGATNALATATVIEAEVEFVPLYKNQPLFGDIQLFLAEHGFMLHKFIDVGGRGFRPLALGNSPYAAMSQLLFADAVFVRNFTRLDLYSPTQLLKAAAILYEVYNSHDLAHLLLSAYDQRSGTRMAPRFLQAIALMPVLPYTYMNEKLNP